MTRHAYPFDMNDMLQARLESVREARALPAGTERNQKLHIAWFIKRLIESQIQERDSRFVSRHLRQAELIERQPWPDRADASSTKSPLKTD
jgi:hypothetical protein